MKNLLSLSIIVFLCGCASSGVIPLDRGVYYISKSDARFGMGPPTAETIASVYKEANDFCNKNNREVERINNIYTDSGLGKTANFALEFRCVPISK
jgi:hypothetical protein